MTRWEGTVTDDDILDQYLRFYRGRDWEHSILELVDLSDADMRQVTAQGLAAVAEALGNYFEESGISNVRTAVFSPKDLPFGMGRIYEAYAEKSPESVQVFRDRDEALRWLTA